MSKHIIEDAKRCLQCPKPKCTEGCPIGTPIKDVIGLLLESKVMEAGHMLFQNNPLSLVCSHVCPQENQCEGHCVLGKKGSPICISSIESYISDYFLSIFKPTPSLKYRGKVAIIGSGPAGITIAFSLASKHYDVTMFDRHHKIGGILRYGIPEFRLPNSIINRLADKLEESGVKIRPNTTIGVNLNIDELFRDGYHAIFMATGAWRPRKLNIKGETFGHVHYAIEYLKNPDVYRLGKKIIVIGAGNVAMDVARSAFRGGCRDITIACHGDESSITARDYEVQFAKIDGARFEMNKTAVEITDDGVIFADSDNLENKKLMTADSIIIAIGQEPRSFDISSKGKVDVDEGGLVIVDKYGHTNQDGVFAGGDVVTGAKTVVDAVVAAKRVAKAMDEFIIKKQEN